MQIAIIGSGPAGCYLADHLLRLIPGASIDILEKLPVPFGLIRYGVAPDHQSTKNVARLFDRLLSRDRVTFFGNVEVGRDVKLSELRFTRAPSWRPGPHAIVDWESGARSGRVVGSGASAGITPSPQQAASRGWSLVGRHCNGNVAIDVAHFKQGPRRAFGLRFTAGGFEWLRAPNRWRQFTSSDAAAPRTLSSMITNWLIRHAVVA